jgi:hypothetical protein
MTETKQTAGAYLTFAGGGRKNLNRIRLSRFCRAVASWSCLALSGILAPPANAQEILPFPPTASASYRSTISTRHRSPSMAKLSQPRSRFRRNRLRLLEPHGRRTPKF